MNDSTKDSLVCEISERNRVISELRKEIDTIYYAASYLIEHAKATEGQTALQEWDKARPNKFQGKEL